MLLVVVVAVVVVPVVVVCSTLFQGVENRGTKVDMAPTARHVHVVC